MTLLCASQRTCFQRMGRDRLHNPWIGFETYSPSCGEGGSFFAITSSSNYGPDWMCWSIIAAQTVRRHLDFTSIWMENEALTGLDSYFAFAKINFPIIMPACKRFGVLSQQFCRGNIKNIPVSCMETTRDKVWLLPPKLTPNSFTAWWFLNFEKFFPLENLTLIFNNFFQI